MKAIQCHTVPYRHVPVRQRFFCTVTPYRQRVTTRARALRGGPTFTKWAKQATGLSDHQVNSLILIHQRFGRHHGSRQLAQRVMKLLVRKDVPDSGYTYSDTHQYYPSLSNMDAAGVFRVRFHNRAVLSAPRVVDSSKHTAAAALPVFEHCAAPFDALGGSAAAPARFLANGAAALLPPPALGERCHRSLACRRVAVRWRAAFVVPEG